ncbi:PHB depolymerase family esterase [Methylocella sp.]|uniref:extracellular catalytic domain type 1 short-chain-length polyhydroxyalkanoate depolymerase n=1 Tax=Methylocella sp. TaxID=1978226 RepID=UPI0035AF4E34
MKTVLDGALRKAVALTASQRPDEATRVIQEALGAAPREASAPAARPFEPQATVVSASAAPPIDSAAPAASDGGFASSFGATLDAVGAGLGVNAALDVLRERVSATLFGEAPAPEAPADAQGARFVNRSFSCAAGSRRYKLFVPSAAARGAPMPLVVMLHGCTQDADDFALGTGMNALAEERGFLVAYPRQSSSSNHMGCWNWFKAKDQIRESGEPAIIAGVTREIMEDFPVDVEQVFVAGMSAGGAMAAILAVAYPDLYKAVGIHSGLHCGAATDFPSALAAMKHGATLQGTEPPQANVRTIVFQGGADRTVHPANAETIVSVARAGIEGARETVERGLTAGGAPYERIVIADASGAPQVEYWSMPGLGHAWSGGYPEGSYTDPAGPDASREMLRFFMD